MLQIAFVKKRRSSFLVKPASCETLLRRTSISRLTPAFFNQVKKVSADFFVNPIVKSFIQPDSLLLNYQGAQQSHKQCAPLVCGRHPLTTVRGSEPNPALAN